MPTFPKQFLIVVFATSSHAIAIDLIARTTSIFFAISDAD